MEGLDGGLYELLRGMVLGLLVAAPVGPIGILCIRRTLLHGWRTGLLTGWGAASADAIFAAIAAFGLASVIHQLAAIEPIIRFLGGLLVVWIGIRLWQSPPSTQAAQPKRTHWGAYGSALLLTLSNPLTIISFVGLFGASSPFHLGIHMGDGAGITAPLAQTDSSIMSTILLPILLMIGVGLGSFCWWTLLSSGVHILRRNELSPVWMQRINRLSGMLLMLLGILAIWNTFV